MTGPTLSDALRTVAAGGHVSDEPDLFAAAAHLIDRLTQDLATQKGLALAQALAMYTPPRSAQAAEVGACGASGVGAPQVDGATEPGGHATMWDGGGGWL